MKNEIIVRYNAIKQCLTNRSIEKISYKEFLKIDKESNYNLEFIDGMELRDHIISFLKEHKSTALAPCLDANQGVVQCNILLVRIWIFI